MLNLLISSRKTGSAVVEFATVKAAVSLAETPDVCNGGWARRGVAEEKG